MNNIISKLITIVFLFSTLDGLGQSDNEKLKWGIGFSFSPDIYLNTTSYIPGELINYKLEPTGLSFTTGIVGQFNINSKFEVITGLNYSKKSFTETWYCSRCFIFTGSKALMLEYIEVPTLIRYHFLGNSTCG